MSDFAFEAAVARAYVDSLRTSLHNMTAATELHGLPPDAEALLSAIKSALAKADAISTKAGVTFLAERHQLELEDKARAQAAEEEWRSFFAAAQHGLVGHELGDDLGCQ